MEMENTGVPKPKLSEEAVNSREEFASVFTEAVQSSDHVLAMIATVAVGPGHKPMVMVRLFKQGSIDSQKAYAVCMKALEGQINAKDITNGRSDA